MKKVVLFLSLTVLCQISLSKELNPWQHCGLGAIIFPETPVGAAISNITSDLGTTAVLSKLLSEESCAGNPASQAAIFIYDSYADLEEETLKGEGQHVAALLEIYNCDAEAKIQVKSGLQSKFVNDLSQQDYAKKAKFDKVKAYLNNFDGLAKSTCGA